MGAVTSADQIVREDLSDLYINLDVRDTPFLSRLKTGENLMNVKLFSWALEQYDGRQIVGVPENKDADEFETDKQYQLYNRSQKFWRKPHVTTEANTVNKAPADFGKFDRQKLKKIEEQKRDLQTKALGDTDSRDDDGLIGREFMAAGRFFNDGTSVGVAGAALTFTDAQTAVPALWRTPTAQIYVGYLYTGTPPNLTALDFNFDVLNNMMQNRYDALGMSSTFSCFCDAAFKRHMTRVEQYAGTITNYTAITRIPQQALGSKTRIEYGADLWESDFGPVDINLITFMPRNPTTGALSGRAYFLDMEYIYARYSGLHLTYQDLEDKGAGPRGLIQTIMGIMWGDPRSALKVDPVGVSH